MKAKAKADELLAAVETFPKGFLWDVVSSLLEALPDAFDRAAADDDPESFHGVVHTLLGAVRLMATFKEPAIGGRLPGCRAD